MSNRNEEKRRQKKAKRERAERRREETKKEKAEGLALAIDSLGKLEGKSEGCQVVLASAALPSAEPVKPATKPAAMLQPDEDLDEIVCEEAETEETKEGEEADVEPEPDAAVEETVEELDDECVVVFAEPVRTPLSDEDLPESPTALVPYEAQAVALTAQPEAGGLDEFQRKLVELHAEFSAVKRERDTLNERLKQAKKNLDSACQVRNAATKARDEILAAHDRMEAERDELKDKLEAAEQKYNELLAKCDRLQAELAKARQDIDEYLEIARLELDEAKAAQVCLRQERDQARAERDSAREACDELVEAADARTEEIRVESVRLATALAAANDEVKGLRDAAETAPPQNVSLLVERELEDRVRQIARDLYNQSLGTAEKLRKLYDGFTEALTGFNASMVDWQRLIATTLDREQIDIEIDIARGRLAADRSEAKASAFAAAIEKVRQARDSFEAIEGTARGLKARIEAIREEHLKEIERAKDLGSRAIAAKEMATMFGLPCPSEVARQFEDTVRHADLLDNPSEKERSHRMRSCQARVPIRPPKLNSLFEALSEHTAFLYRNRDPRQYSVFTDAPDRKEEIRRLIVMAFAFSRTKEVEEGEEKGLGMTTIVETVLPKGGLIHEDEVELARTIARSLMSRLDTVSFASYALNKTGQAEAEKSRQQCASPEAVVNALRFGLRAHWEDKYANRRRSSA